MTRQEGTIKMCGRVSYPKKKLTKLLFEVPAGKRKGIFIWEPFNTWEAIFDSNGKSNDLLKVYDELIKKYLQNK